MTRKTLDQIRVEVALMAIGKVGGGADGGEKVKNFPTMIQTNGLLGALAYATERKKDKAKKDLVPKNTAELKMAEFICRYLNKLSENGYTVTENKDLSSPKVLIDFLVDCTPEQFRRVNAEVMAFMNYFRRFAS